jgi:hypothetical protein
MTTIREVSLSPEEQGELEEVYYKFDFARLGTPTNPICYLFDVQADTDVSAACLKNAASILGTVVTAQQVYNLDKGRRYKLECLATVGGSLIGGYLYIDCTE